MSIDIKMIRDSFELAKPIAEEVVAKFYEFLFNDYPGAKPLFEGVDMERQQKQLLGALVLAVDNLDNPEKLTDYLQKSGARHVGYGVKEDHYPLVGNTLIKTFAHFFQDKWTPELEAEWTKVYQFIAEQMLIGAKSVQPELDDVREKAKRICNKVLMDMIEEELEDEFIESVRFRVRKLLVQVLDEESQKLFNKAA